jgi:hypothetical protein
VLEPDSAHSRQPVEVDARITFISMWAGGQREYHRFAINTISWWPVHNHIDWKHTVALDTHNPSPVYFRVARSFRSVEDDEFDRWPGQKDLTGAVKGFTIQRGTYKGLRRSELGSQSKKPHGSPHESILEDDEEPFHDPWAIRGANLTLQEHEDYMDELADKDCGNPGGRDAHDEVMEQFYSPDCSALSARNPAGHPHLLQPEVYLNDKDIIVQNARPRLVDATATMLYKTGPKCLADFLDFNVKVFEWRRNGKCLMIRRVGNEVLVGTFHNYGMFYVWTYFVKSEISDAGAWKEVYAGTSLITTPVSGDGVQFEKWEADWTDCDIDPEEERFALYMGRCLGFCLLARSVWNFRAWRKWTVEWEADGVVTRAKEHANLALRTVWKNEE